MGVPCYIADREAKRLMNEDPVLKRRLLAFLEMKPMGQVFRPNIAWQYRIYSTPKTKCTKCHRPPSSGKRLQKLGRQSTLPVRH